jgi:hypothetical protein
MNRQRVATAATAMKEKREIARFPNISLQRKGRSPMLWRRTAHALIVRDARRWVRRHIQAISGIVNLARFFPYPSTIDRACGFPSATRLASPPTHRHLGFHMYGVQRTGAGFEQDQSTAANDRQCVSR